MLFICSLTIDERGQVSDCLSNRLEREQCRYAAGSLSKGLGTEASLKQLFVPTAVREVSRPQLPQIVLVI